MELTVFCEPFDGFDMLALASDGKGQTRTDDATVNDYATGPADSDAATFLGASEADVVAQGLEKQAVGFHSQIVFLSVDDQLNLLFHDAAAYILLRGDSTCQSFDGAEARSSF